MTFASAIDDPLVPRHPTQLYEAAFHFGMAAVLLWLGRRNLFTGQLIKLYLITYLLFRFATEFIRPEMKLWFGLTGYQWAAAAMLPIFVALWIRDRRSSGSTVNV